MGLTIRKKPVPNPVPPTPAGDYVVIPNPRMTKDDLTEADRLVSHDSTGKFAKGNKYGVKPGFHPRRSPVPPKPITLSAAFRQKLMEPCPWDPAKRPWAEMIADTLCMEAAAGKVPAAKELREATEGNKHNIQTDWRQVLKQGGGNPDQLLYEALQVLQGGQHSRPEVEEEEEEEEE